MKKLLLILMLYTALFTSCFNLPDKPAFSGNSCTENCIIFKGKVWDPNNERPVDALVTITHTSEGWFNTKQTIGKFHPEDDGSFAFRFEGSDFKHDYGYFELRAAKEGYMTNQVDGRILLFDIDSTDFDFPTTTDILLLPKANLQVYFSTASANQISSFSYSYQYSHNRYRVVVPWEGRQRDTVILNVAGDQEVDFAYEYTIDGKNKQEEKSIYIDAGTKETLWLVLD